MKLQMRNLLEIWMFYSWKILIFVVVAYRLFMIRERERNKTWSFFDFILKTHSDDNQTKKQEKKVSKNLNKQEREREVKGLNKFYINNNWLIWKQGQWPVMIMIMIIIKMVKGFSLFKLKLLTTFKMMIHKFP